MKRINIILTFLMLFAISATAQVKIGYFSYDAALKSMPDYTKVLQDMDQLRAQYDVEAKRSEDDFNAKYEDFLENMNGYATSIRRKRQSELQTIMETNIQFRSEAQRLLKQAEAEALVPLRQKLDETLRNVASAHGFIIILNTDSNACPFIDPALGEDVNTLVQEALK